MEMALERMTIENFKGTKFLEVRFGRETRISGRNGLGKTTIADAFFWVLLGRDSHGNAPGTNNFREKPLDADGSELHNLTTSVELACTLDGKPFTLKRAQSENWVKKRGQGEAVFSGNVSNYWINGVETKAGDFKAAVASLCSEEVFGYIASLSAFNRADVKDRRSVLVSMSDADAASELLEREEYRFIAEETAARNIRPEDLKKVLQDQLKLQNADLKLIPARIDEARRLMPSFEDYAVADAKELVSKADAQLESIDRQIAAAMANDAGAMLAERVLDAQRRVEERRGEISGKHLTALCEARGLIARREQELDAAQKGLVNRRFAVQKAQQQLDTQRQLAEQLRAKWKSVRDETFQPPEVEEVCPTCHQAIPPEQRQQVLDNARAAFTASQRKRLEDISRQGKEAAAFAASLEPMLTDAQKEATRQEAAVQAAEKALRDAQAQQLPAQPDYDGDERLTALTAEWEALKKQQQESGGASALTALRQQRAEIVLSTDKAKEILAAWKAAQDAKKRVGELEQRQRALGDSIAETERRVMLVERFMRERCALLEESINGHFPTVRWKLFDQQINGGMAETCICMVPCGGCYVPYPTANTASQLTADLEIIDALSKRYDTRLPVFFDNRERVNVLPPVDGQLITLAVTTDDPLKVEIVKA